MTLSWCLLRSERHWIRLLDQPWPWIRAEASPRPPRSRSNLRYHERPFRSFVRGQSRCVRSEDVIRQQVVDGLKRRLEKKFRLMIMSN